MPKTATFPPGPKGLPIVGNALQFQRNPLQFVREMQTTYGNMATIHLNGSPIVLLFRPEYIRYVLTEQPKNFTKANRRGGPNLRAFLGDGLLTIEGDFHRQQRRLVQPAFHKRRVESYAGTMVQQAQEMLAEWQPGTELNIASAMQQLTLRIIAKTLFNVESHTLIAELGQAFNDVIENPVRTFSGLKVLRLPFQASGESKNAVGRRTLDEFIYALIAERRADGRDVGDVLSMLLAAQD